MKMRHLISVQKAGFGILALAFSLASTRASAQSADPSVTTLDSAAAQAIVNAAKQVIGDGISRERLLSLRNYSVALTSTNNTVTAVLGSPRGKMHFTSSVPREGALQATSPNAVLSGSQIEALVAATTSWESDIASQGAPSNEAPRLVEIGTPPGSQSRVIVTFRYPQSASVISNGRIILRCDKALSYTVWLTSGVVTKNKVAC